MWKANFLGIEFFYIFYLFFVYSFIGWIYESLLVSVQKRTPINRGFLNGPVIPIYGLGALVIYLVLWRFRENPLLIFAGGALLATVLEYVTSLLMELIFHTKWWDYSNYRYNIGGRVCLGVSLLWGMFSVLLLKGLHPLMDRLILNIPRRMGEISGYVIILLFLADITVTVIYTVKFDRLLTRIHRLRQELIDYIASYRFLAGREELLERLSGLRLAGILRELVSSMDIKLHRRFNLHTKAELSAASQETQERIGEFLRRYQALAMEKIYIRILKAFPSMRAGKRDTALKDLRERVFRKGVLKLGKEIRNEVTGRIKGYLSGFLRAAVVGLLVLAQFVMIIALSLWLRGYTIYLYSILQVLSVIIIIGLINDNRNVSYKISWICIIAAFPVTGHIMFMLWGNRRSRPLDRKVLEKLSRGYPYLKQDEAVMEEFTEKYPSKLRMARYLEQNHFPMFMNNKVEYYPMAEETFEAIFDEIGRAEKFILINFFIVGEGALWDRMHELLLKKIGENVRVLFLYDDFGAMLRTPRTFRRDLEREGFEVRVFNPIHRYTDKLYMNYRSHQKIIVIDGNIGFTGGMNLADEYVNLVERFGIWKDNAVKLTGDAVWGLTVTFLQMWEASSNNGQVDYLYFCPTMKFEENDVFCQVISDGPANNPKNPIENIYKQMIYYARRVLYITTPYLIIEDDMRDALIMAAESGVDVRIITPFIPDKKNVKILTNYNYGRLLKAGVRVFEYKPGFIHAKTIISEDCAVVGTINMDYRSFHLQYECGVFICNREVIGTIKQDLLKTMEQSHEVSYEEWKNRPLHIKAYQKVLNLFSTLM